MNKVYVQHISGKGKKYLVTDDYITWMEVVTEGGCKLPKDEYRICDSPERWEIVPVVVVEYGHLKSQRDPGGIYHGDTKLAQLMCGGKYRIKELVVERKVTE